jgi:hypothetical protein
MPLTAIGRATARLLNFGDKDREEARNNVWQASHLQP